MPKSRPVEPPPACITINHTRELDGWPKQGSTAEAAARKALNAILPLSVAQAKEYGGVIYTVKGRFYALPPRTQCEPDKVDTGRHEVNHSAPDGSRAVAVYHTHPSASIAGDNTDYNKFSPSDERLGRGNGVVEGDGLDDYLGTVDGSFFRFEAKTGRTLRLQGKLDNGAQRL
ncbi:DUF4329 domain-containing protein [Caldimonas brevitalea]|uniref:DUF4329 domain-containing protein n=1 Tax=Caldimonas brevitalea TaxID=413882 RepID=A0A0G3BR13_9BURK|nr:DUF4329 domain-containing protein [Caldimonas brevitalea]AKJ31859.1 hypothetical protein AAW51_5168 [Caldimonas brevitalea]